MPSAGSPKSKKESPPSEFADTVPPEVAGNHSFLLQAIFELKGSFSRVEEKVDSLRAQADKLDAGLDAVKHQMSFVKGGIWVVGGVFGIIVVVLGWWATGDVRLKFERGTQSAPAASAVAAPPAVTPSGKAG